MLMSAQLPLAVDTAVEDEVVALAAELVMRVGAASEAALGLTLSSSTCTSTVDGGRLMR